MPKGVPKKKAIVTKKKEEPVLEVKEESKPVVPEAKHAEEKKEEAKPVLKNTLPPLEPTQQYFEAPDGTVLVGEKSATRLWYRKESIWINPKR